MDSKKKPSEVTELLRHLGEGGQLATDRLFAAVYKELRSLAGQFFRQERPDQTLQATALVHETYLKLVDQRCVDWQGRAHFLGVAAQAMRRILLDHARRRGAAKRGGGWKRITLNDRLIPGGLESDEELMALDDALRELSEVDPRQAQMIELRFFGGLSVEEVAQVLEMSKRSVEREWTMVRAWLRRELKMSTG
jgi:RNA polymerase sigma factor (TIGR02999 family)